MRTDLITPENAPALCRLAEEGVTFGDRHAVYVSRDTCQRHRH